MQQAKISGSMAMVPAVWHHLSSGHAESSGELFQTSLMSALLDGVYEGSMTYGELHRHGDFGLGTFNDLDGEMIGFDGIFYQLRSDGSAQLVADDQKTPFAVVTFFEPDRELTLPGPTTKDDLLSEIERATDANLFTAIKVTGIFKQVRTRTVQRQVKPFAPLAEAATHEAINTFADVRGTLAGFRTPAYAQGIGVAGFHLHFLSEDKQSGGHALDYVLSDTILQLSTMHSFHVELPASPEFLQARLTGDSVSDAIKATEG